MADHARLGPSNHRWPNCPGSVREEAKYHDVSGKAAIDGTGSHLLLEMCLLNNVRAESYDTQVIGVGDKDQPNGWMVHRDRIERVQMCLDYVTRRFKELKAKYPNAVIEIVAEGKSNPGALYGRTDWWGPCDITITVMEAGTCPFLETIDYKDGRMWVGVKGNTQFTSYTGGRARPFIGAGPQLVKPFNPAGVYDGVRHTVVQPKTNPVIRYEDLTTAELIKRLDKMWWAAVLTDDPDAPLIPDDKGGKGYCSWCKHKKNCNAGSTRSLEVIAMSSDVETTGEPLFKQMTNLLSQIPKDMTGEQLAEIASAKTALIASFIKYDDEILDRVSQGLLVPGYTMRPGKGSKKWNCDDEVIQKRLTSLRLKKADCWPAKIITPAAMLKLDSLTKAQKSKLEGDLISTIVGKDVMTKVAVGDENERKVKKDLAGMFTNVTQSNTLAPQTKKLSFR